MGTKSKTVDYRSDRHWSNCGGTRGTVFPFCFWRGNAVPLAYTTAVGGQATEKMCVKCMI